VKKLFLAGIAALSLFNTAGARADASFPTRLVWQCGKATVTWSMNEVPNHEYPRSWFSYQVTGIEKPNNRFGLDDDGLYMNGKLCWPVEPVTCLRPDGTTESCESRQISFPRPRPAEAPKPIPIEKTVLYNEPGGVLGDHIKRWEALAASGNDVEIRGHCVSGCTLIMAYVPSERICFDSNAVLEFHAAAYSHDKYERNLKMTKWMFDQYPQNIREWFKARDVTPEEMQVYYYWRIYAADLWAMGYRKCEPEASSVPMTQHRTG